MTAKLLGVASYTAEKARAATGLKEPTLLGGGEPIDPRKRELEDEALDAARAIVWGWFTSYEGGEIKLEKLCSVCRDALAAENVPDYMRWKLLGEVVERALAADPPKRARSAKRGRTLFFCRVAYELTEAAVRREGLPRTRAASKPRNAFERAAQIMLARGIKQATAATVEHGRSEWLRNQDQKTRKSK